MENTSYGAGPALAIVNRREMSGTRRRQPESKSLAAVGVWPANGARRTPEYSVGEMMCRRIAAALVLVLTALPISGRPAWRSARRVQSRGPSGRARITTYSRPFRRSLGDDDVSSQASPSACPDELRGSAALAKRRAPAAPITGCNPQARACCPLLLLFLTRPSRRLRARESNGEGPRPAPFAAASFVSDRVPLTRTSHAP